MIVPGFHNVPCRNAAAGGATITNPGREKWDQAGEPCFMIRLAATEVGTYCWWVVARDRAGQAQSNEHTLRCVPSESSGFVRVSPRNPRAFELDSGDPFIPIGMCIAWARGDSEQDTYDYYFGRLAESACNAVRVWQCHWAWLEWTKGETGSLQGCDGVGRYNQMTAANFDDSADHAEGCREVPDPTNSDRDKVAS